MNWNEFLDEDYISDHSWFNALHFSRNWISCACGQLCDLIPRSSSGRPLDQHLYNLGVAFHSSIVNKNKDYAKYILSKIEERSTELLKDL